MAGELGLDAAETLEAVRGHAVEAVIGPDSIDSVFRVTGVVDEIEGFEPRTFGSREEDAMHSRAHLGEGCRTSPVASGTSHNGVNVHQGYQGASGPWVRQGDGIAGAVLNLGGVAGVPGVGASRDLRTCGRREGNST